MSEHAIDWIAATLREQPQPVTLVPTGPLTNVALLLARYPDVEAIIERVVLMGGAIGEGNVTPAAEFNIWADPEAARRVFSSSLEVTMVGLDVTHRALIDAGARRAARGVRAGPGGWPPTCSASTGATTGSATAGTAHPCTTPWRSHT